ncbi:SMP-30/gluconolactonase/LRE family protein [Thalassotalea sp. PLHSN55]|uniref:SMP-30/gluconolactonase/LRE family protein n=1 Tax=Thalassotalea sp. PLHSN55 TaxID=3435888 RepID=UPI003F864ECD
MNNAQVGELLFSVDVSNQLGEGVQWHKETQSIWWTDIESSCLWRYSTLTKDSSNPLTKYAMPERVGCFAFIKGDDRLVIAFSSGIALYHLASKQLSWLAQPEKHLQHHRFNDGRVDRQGRFWAGTLYEGEAPNTGELASLYMLDHQQECHNMLANIEISNGLCWSLDGNILYHADSPTQCIYQYQMKSDSGLLTDKQLFAKTSENSFPDGSCIDADGYLWNAQWGGSKVVRYAPNGEINLIQSLLVSQPSCVAIGGPNMDWLIVTSAKQGLTTKQLAKEPQAGNLFVYQLNHVKGVEESQCQTNFAVID